MPADNPSTAIRSIDEAVTLRTAVLEDAAQIRNLVAESESLEANSCYCYLLLCRDFAETCIVTCREQEILGFVAAYRPPKHQDTIFVWQVGVADGARRQGLAKRMLRSLVLLPECKGVRFLTATVTPSNTASHRLFRSLADELGVPCQTEPGFTPDMFGAGDHEQEELLRIGPFADSHKENLQT